MCTLLKSIFGLRYGCREWLEFIKTSYLDHMLWTMLDWALKSSVCLDKHWLLWEQSCWLIISLGTIEADTWKCQGSMLFADTAMVWKSYFTVSDGAILSDHYADEIIRAFSKSAMWEAGLINVPNTLFARTLLCR